MLVRSTALLLRRMAPIQRLRPHSHSYSVSPVFPDSNFTAEFPLQTYNNRLVAYVPHLPSVSARRQAITKTSLNEMFMQSFDQRKAGKPFTISDYWNRAGSTLEMALDPIAKKPAACIAHNYSFEFNPAGTPVIIYYPRVWAVHGAAGVTDPHIDNNVYTGLAIIQTLMARFAYYLQLTNPSIPCYMVVPTYTLWVLRMLNNYFGVSLDINSFSQLPEEDQRFIDFLSSKFSEGEVIRNDLGYPLYKLPYPIKVPNIKDNYYTSPDPGVVMSEQEEFCNQMMQVGGDSFYDPSSKLFGTYGMLSVIPCSEHVLNNFLSASTKKSTDYRRVFGSDLPPDDLLMSIARKGDKYPSFLHDLAELYDFDVGGRRFCHPGLKGDEVPSVAKIEKIVGSVEHTFFSNADGCQAGSFKNAAHLLPEAIQNFQPKPITFRDVLPETSFLLLDKSGEEQKVSSVILRVRNMPDSQVAFLLDKICPILGQGFESGSLVRREAFAKRFDREHSYVEVFFSDEVEDGEAYQGDKDVWLRTGSVVGFLFHEPFQIQMNNDDLKVIVLKSGLGCFANNFRQKGLAKFCIRRFLLKLQDDFPGVPCYHHFLASSPAMLSSEFNLKVEKPEGLERSDLFLDSFYPERPKRDESGEYRFAPHSIERQLGSDEAAFVHAVFCAEVVLKFEHGGAVLNGMLPYADLPSAIPYPIVPRIDPNNPLYNISKLDKGEGSELEQLDPRETVGLDSKSWLVAIYTFANARMLHNIKRYGMGAEQQLFPSVRCFSRLSKERANAYFDANPSNLFVCYRGEEGEERKNGGLVEAVGLLSAKGFMANPFQMFQAGRKNLSNKGGGLREGIISNIPANQEDMRRIIKMSYGNSSGN